MSLNILLNVIGTAITAAVGLVTMPFLVSRLGFEGYGLWSLVGGVCAYVGLLDFCVSASLARLIAAKRADDDVEGIGSLMSTGLAMLLVLAVVAITPMLVAAHMFIPAFHVPALRHNDVYQSIIIMAVGVCLGFPLSIFPALGFGYERFDLENLIDIATLLGRAGAMFAFITPGSGLTEMALIVAGSNFIGAVASGILCWQIEPRLRLAWSRISFRAFREIYEYAGPYWVLIVTRTIPAQIGPFLIGHFLTGELVASFTIARQLVAYGTALVWAASRTMTPRAALLRAAGQDEAGVALFINASRYALAMSLVLTCGLISLGDPFLDLWMGPGPSGDSAYVFLVILALGEALPMSQWITSSILTGLGRNLVLVIIGLIETVALVAVALLLIFPYGVVGVCVAYAAAAVLVRGVILMVQGCRIIGVGLGSYLRKVVLVVILTGAVPLAIGAALNLFYVPETYARFILSGLAFSALQAPFLAYFLLRLGGHEIGLASWRARRGARTVAAPPRSA